MLPRHLLVILLALPVTGGALAVASEVTGTSSAPRAHLELDASAPLFSPRNADNLRPGQTETACVNVTNAGSASGRPALYAPAVSGDLARFLQLTVTRGTRTTAAPSGSCASFAADRAAYGADEPGVVFRGPLSAFPQTRDSALLDPQPWAAGDRHAYRFALTLVDDPAAVGRTAQWDWRLAVDSLAAAVAAPQPARSAATASTSQPASGCSALTLAGAGRGLTRTLRTTVRISRHARAVLTLRTSVSGGAPRASATTGLRVRGDKTLLIPGWASVRYRLNGSRVRSGARRPFRLDLGAASLRAGRNRVSIAVQRSGHASKALAVFTLNVRPTTVAGRTVCMVSA